MGNALSFIKRWSGPVLRRFRSAMPVLLGLAVLFALIGIWWLGPHWVWREYTPLAEMSMRVLATVLVLTAPLLFWALWLRQRYQQLHAERQHAEAVQADPCLPYIQAQERALNRNLASYLGNARGRRSLYQLPWYLVLGEENAGKTSFITRSGQSFALTRVTKPERKVQDQHLAYPVEWWIGDDAVLIDPPGEFISQQGPGDGEDGDVPTAVKHARSKPRLDLPDGTHGRLWAHLLQWLAEHRSRRALNGIVLVVDIVELLQKSPEQRTEHAHQLRTRLFELTRELGTRLPLYVVISKVDLLEGFEELFSRLPPTIREEVMGFTFSLDAVDDFDAWFDEFAQRLETFITGLSEQTLDAMAGAQDPQARQRLTSLFGMLSGIRPTLMRFFNDMLGSDRFTTPALVRGVFLSSVLQQGQTHNAFVLAAAQPHRMEKPATDAKPQGSSVVYFAQRVFQEAIYPEAGLAGDNIKVARSKRRLLLASSGVAAMGVLLATGGWQYYFGVNRDKADNVLAKSHEFSDSDIDARVDTTGRNLLAPLDQIRDAVSVFGDYRQAWPGVTDVGLYQGRAIGPMVDEAYLSLLSRRFLPAIASGVIDSMNAAPEGSSQQLAALRVYRMIEDRQNRRPKIVEDWMARQWQLAYPGQGQMQAALMQHLAYALKYADADMPQYRERVAQVQQELRKIPMQQRVYMTLKQDAQEHLHTGLDLRNEVGPAFDVVYRPVALSPDQTELQGVTLPPLLTVKGFREYFEPRSEDVTELAMIDQWVLGERRQIDYSEEDRKALAVRLRTLYSADYVDNWRRALNQFSVTDFDDLTHAVTVLEQVTGPAAPLRRLLETVRDNSVLYPAQALVEGQSPAVQIPIPEDGRTQAVAIRRAFSGLSELLQAKGDKPAYYDETLNAVNAVYDYSKTVHDSPDRGKAALTAVLARFSLNGPDPISVLQRVSTGLPEPLNQQVRKLADQTIQVLMIEALRELEKRWDADVYSFYQKRLANRYPFNPAGSDASLEDFEAFLGPKGRLQQFHDQYLNVFIRDNLDALYSKNRGGYLVRSDVLEQLQSAEQIRETFFNNEGALSVQFSLEPLGLSGNKRSSMLNLDGQLIPYSHGPSSRIGLIWPNTLGESIGSKVSLVHAPGTSSSLGFQGPWSLFRLLSRAQLNGRTDTSLDLSFRITDGMMRYRITAEKTLNPFTRRPFHGFSLPRTLLSSPKNSVALNEPQPGEIQR